MILQFIHDGMIFHFTLEAIESNQKRIGFYFDHLGFPQEIMRGSLYGDHIMKRYEKIKTSMQEVNGEEEDEIRLGLPHGIYCDECGEDKDLTYQYTYANGEEYKCGNCDHTFVW